MKLSYIALLVAAAVNQAFAKDDHFYTTSPSGEAAAASGYHLEGVAAYVPDQGVAGTVTVYRWNNPTTGAHFWTTSPTGEEAPALGYYEEGPAYWIFDINLPPPDGSVPWYRWNTPNDHFYSTSYAEGANAGFSFEGVIGYVYEGPYGDDVPLYRWYNG